MNVQVKSFFFETSGRSAYISFFYISDGIKVEEQRSGNKNSSMDREDLFQVEFVWIWLWAGLTYFQCFP